MNATAAEKLADHSHTRNRHERVAVLNQKPAFITPNPPEVAPLLSMAGLPSRSQCSLRAVGAD